MQLRLLIILFSCLLLGQKSLGFVYTSDTPNLVKVINHGSLSLKERLDLINSAKKSIEVEYFIFTTDRTSQLILQALLKKAKEGVKVRMLLDKFLVKKQITPFIAQEMNKFGVEVKYFNTIWNIFFNRAQYRNHRKSIIVDDSAAIIGGRNIGDDYFDIDDSYNFYDRDVVVYGEVAKQVRKSFDIYWNSKLSKLAKRPSRPRNHRANKNGDNIQFEMRLKSWNKKVDSAKKFLFEGQKESITHSFENFWNTISSDKQFDQDFICSKTSFVSDWPSRGRKNTNKARVLKYHIFEMINKAKHKIMIESPYFIMDKDMRRVLESALARGVQVDILTNSLYSSDAVYVGSRFYDSVKDWLKKGMNLHMFAGDSINSYPLINKDVSQTRWGTHAKTIIVDDRTSMIGTYNVDPRSNNFNMEHAFLCHDGVELNKSLELNMKKRLAYAIHLKNEKVFNKVKYERVSGTKMVLYYLVKLPARLFNHLL